MEPLPLPDLVWSDEPLDACLFSGEPLQDREADLELVGLGLGLGGAALRWSEEASCWYAPFDTLLALSKDAGVSPVEAGPFRVAGRPVEAAVYLDPFGALMPWDVFAEQIGGMETRNAAPPPTDAEVRALPELPEAWQLAVAEVGEVLDDDGTPRPLSLLVVADAGGTLRAAVPHAGPVPVGALADAVRAATRVPPGTSLTQARPRQLVFDDPALAEALAPALAESGIAVAAGPTPLADAAIESFRQSGPRRAAVPPLFADDDDDALKAYFDAAQAFYAAEPWDRLRGDLFLAVQDLGEGADAPWTYVSVMGQMREDPGLSLFERWLDVCAMAHGSGPELLLDDPLLEGVTLLPRDALHADDTERLERLGIRPTADGEYAVPKRISLDGFGPSERPLSLHTALLTAIPEAVAARRARTVTSITATVEAAGHRLALRYPARGDEGLSDRAGDIRLTLHGRDGTMPATLREGERLVVEGPASSSAYAVVKAMRTAFKAADRWGYVSAIYVDELAVWFGRASATDPGPTLDDLARADDLELDMTLEEPLEVTVERLSPGAAPKLRAEVVRE